MGTEVPRSQKANGQECQPNASYPYPPMACLGLPSIVLLRVMLNCRGLLGPPFCHHPLPLGVTFSPVPLPGPLSCFLLALFLLLQIMFPITLNYLLFPRFEQSSTYCSASYKLVSNLHINPFSSRLHKRRICTFKELWWLDDKPLRTGSLWLSKLHPLIVHNSDFIGTAKSNFQTFFSLG